MSNVTMCPVEPNRLFRVDAPDPLPTVPAVPCPDQAANGRVVGVLDGCANCDALSMGIATAEPVSCPVRTISVRNPVCVNASPTAAQSMGKARLFVQVKVVVQAQRAKKRFVTESASDACKEVSNDGRQGCKTARLKLLGHRDAGRIGQQSFALRGHRARRESPIASERRPTCGSAACETEPAEAKHRSLSVRSAWGS